MLQRGPDRGPGCSCGGHAATAGQGTVLALLQLREGWGGGREGGQRSGGAVGWWGMAGGGVNNLFKPLWPSKPLWPW